MKFTRERGPAGRGVRVETSRITLQPLGGLAHAQPAAPSPRAEIWIALAGPLTHALWFVLAGAPYLFFLRTPGAEGAAAAGDLRAFMIEGFLWTNAGLLFLNLLPFWPSDMGRVLRASLALRMHPNHASLLAAYAGFAGAAVLGTCGVAILIEADPTSALASIAGPALLFVAVSSAIASRTLLLESRWGDSPYAAAETWRAPLPQQAWNYEDPTPAEPVHVEERRERRAVVQTAPPRRREPVRPAAVPLHERIDELLDRINEVGGVANLSEAERKELADASETLRSHRGS